jgi:hypothetical protein
MALRTGPSYREWIDVIAHSRLASFGELKAMAERIASSDVSPLTEGQRADLLERLGDLQVAAAQRHGFTDSHDLKSGPAMS